MNLRTLFIGTVGLLLPFVARAATDLKISVLDASGKAVQDVVLIASSTNGLPPRTASPAPAIMDQINKEFVPEVLVVRTGTPVLFPNSDSVAHQVYSFSATKRFALPLYRGRPYPPVIFDTPGIITLGCNIHDDMVGYIVVTESPHFAQSDAQGSAVIQSLPPGIYRISAWHPRMNEQVADQSIVIADAQNVSLTFRLTKALRPIHRPGHDPRIRDY